MPFFERDSVRIHYEEAGDGPAVIFSHGILMDLSMFDAERSYLEERYRCVGWDARGHGETESAGGFSYWDLAGDLLALLGHLSIERALLVGMSQGGFISLRAALTEPERVAGLFLIDSQAGMENPDMTPAYEAMLEEWTTTGPSERLAEVVANIILGPADHEPWIKKWMSRPADSPIEPFRCLVGRDDITDRLAEIEAPALVVHGEADPAIPIERAEALCAGLPRCEGLHRIPGAGHAANLSHPDAVEELLLDFCSRHLG
jgi:pimeloyl-ACP methyl ester carboxylesterase